MFCLNSGLISNVAAVYDRGCSRNLEVARRLKPAATFNLQV
jgi:hypothetical protein